MSTYIRTFPLMLGLALAGPAVAQDQFAANRAAAELPTFELMGFPITQVQVQVLGSSHVRERSATPKLMLGGMPVSPHQMAVLTPRPRTTKAAIAVDGKGAPFRSR
jgi:hypothetical protein